MFKSFTTSQTKPTSYREEIVSRKSLYRPYVTDGLKVYYDFANRASQQSGIARAYNLAGDDATAIHYNSPTYTVDGALTHMAYDGVNDFSQFIYDNSNVVDSITIEMIVKINQYGKGMFTGTYGYDVYLVGGLGFNTGNGENRGVSESTLTSVYNANTQFNHYTFTFNNDANENLMYINGDLQTLSFVAGRSHHPTPKDLTHSNFANWRIANWMLGGQNAYIDIAEFKLYDRELSAREVAYNYGVAKSRKGV